MSAEGRVRRASAADIPALVELMREFYGESDFPLDEGPAARTFERLLASPDRGAVWLMLEDGRPAGFIVLTLAFSMEYGALRGFVDDLFVSPRFRKRGLASEAIAEVRRHCLASDVRALLVETSLENDRAVRVYRQAGFEENGRLLLSQPLGTPVHEQDGNG